MSVHWEHCPSHLRARCPLLQILLNVVFRCYMRYIGRCCFRQFRTTSIRRREYKMAHSMNNRSINECCSLVFLEAGFSMHSDAENAVHRTGLREYLRGGTGIAVDEADLGIFGEPERGAGGGIAC